MSGKVFYECYTDNLACCCCYCCCFFNFFAGGGKEGVMLARLQLFESSIKFFSMLQEFAPLLLK